MCTSIFRQESTDASSAITPQREAAFLELAQHLYSELEVWYDNHPQASFGEIEAETRRRRRDLMGEMLAVLINGRDVGYQLQPPLCAECGQAMEFEKYRGWQVKGLEGDTELQRAYYVCPHCEGQTFFPLDHKLHLRADHWSEGAARVVTRQGLQAKSFALAAEAYTEAVGGEISADSLRRVTEGWGAQVEVQRTAEAERANTVAQRGESPQTQRVVEVAPIAGQANVSTDGTMILVRGESWKEVKLTAISAVTVKPADERGADPAYPSRRDADSWVTLSQHSYQAGLWDADTMALHQYAEGLRRGLERSERLSSVNDAAEWIERITQTNFSRAVQIVDWTHASEHVWGVGKAVFGEDTRETKTWVNTQLDELWRGAVQKVITNLDTLEAPTESGKEAVRQARVYFRNQEPRMHYADYRAAGYPIGSGTVESAANTVVHHRMRRPGRGWKRDYAQALLAGLSELHSGRFDRAWKKTLPVVA